MIPAKTIYTYTGVQFPLYGGTGSVDIMDIAHALSMQCRFTGHLSAFYSVAQHSVWVSLMVSLDGGSRAEAACGLLHDATEAYLADVARPFKAEIEGYAKLEAMLQSRIMHRFGLEQYADSEPEIVKKWDCIAALVEARDLHVEGVWEDFDAPAAYKEQARRLARVQPVTAKAAYRSFLTEFSRYIAQGVLR